MLTPLGRQIRRLRIDKSVRLLDMAEAFGVTSSFLSAVENGRKAMPDDWVSKLDQYFKGFGVSRAEWARLAEDSKPKVVLNLTGASSFDRETCLAFGRNYMALSPEKKKRLRRLLTDDE